MALRVREHLPPVEEEDLILVPWRELAPLVEKVVGPDVLNHKTCLHWQNNRAILPQPQGFVQRGNDTREDLRNVEKYEIMPEYEKRG
jgi:hypothetical protein